jgi:hypothetical protein
VARAVLVEDPEVVVWWATRTECVSAFVRRLREDELTAAGERQARDVLETLAGAWTEVLPSEPVRLSTERLLAVHPLRAADAFQLAAALAWCQGHPTGRALVTFDARLGAAGRREGFAILPSGGSGGES